MVPIEFSGAAIYADVPVSEDGELADLVAAVVAQQRAAARRRLRGFRPPPDAARAASPEALDALLAAGRHVHGIAQDRSISNAIIFNTHRYPDALRGPATMAARARVDDWVRARLAGWFTGAPPLRLVNAGFFLYPPGGYMGWHTNARVPGWRVMLSAADAPGRSFFRYRDPTTGDVVTSLDGRLNLRLNRLSGRDPVWHTVYSETHRFSLVYAVEEA